MRVFPGSLIAVLIGLLLAVPSGRAAAADCPAQRFGPLVECLASPQGRDIVLNGPIELGGPLTQDLPLRQAREQFARRGFTVTVPKGVTTGSGGAVLLALAPREARIVAGDAVLTLLSSEQVRALREFGGCGRADPFCDTLAGEGTLPGQALLDRGLAIDAAGRTPLVVGSSAAVRPSPDGSGGGLLNPYTIVALGVALALAGYLAWVYRGRFAGAESS
ncbi:hypothetical protein, partial [Actinocorallia lasiicapitis]